MKEIKVMVDKRVELIGIMLRLANYSDKFPHLVYNLQNYPYLENVVKWFDGFKNHKAIQTLNKIIDECNFSYDAPVTLFLQLDENYNFHGENDYPFVGRLKKASIILEFLKQVKDFVKVSNFEKFFAENQESYQKEIQSFTQCQDLTKVIPFMEQLFKTDFKDKVFQINLALLLTGGGFAAWVDKSVFCTDCKHSDREGNALSNWGKDSPRGQSHYLHEFCHSMINPLTEKYCDAIKDINFSQEDKEKLIRSAYGGKSCVINEYIIRAIQVVYIREQGVSPEELMEWWEDKVGFNKNVVNKLAERIVAIKKNKDSTFEEQYVELANTIAETYNQQEA